MVSANFLKDFEKLPNLITLCRITWSPLLWYLLSEKRFVPAFILFLALGLTDWLDGRVARRTDEVTALGSVLDPLADKFFFLPTSWFLLPGTLIPLWTVLVGFEGVLLSLGVFGLYKYGLDPKRLGANIFGKIKMRCEIAFVAMLLLVELGLPVSMIKIMSIEIIIWTLWSAILFASLSIIGHLLHRPAA